MTADAVYAAECGYSESKIQHTCVKWFRDTHPELAQLMFAVSNGGARSLKAGAICKYEGQLKGVADVILLVGCGAFHSLAIEMKTPKSKGKSAGVQKPEQKDWQQAVQKHGSRYVVCHGLVEFVTTVSDYLGESTIDAVSEAVDRYEEWLCPFPPSGTPAYRKTTNKKNKENDEYNKQVLGK